MWERFLNLLAPPVFLEDEEKTRVARLLNVIIIIVMLLVMLFSVPALVLTPDLGRVLIELLLGILALVMLIVLRRGYVRAAGFMLTFTVWALVTYGTYEAGGFYGSTMSSYFGIILIAYLLLGASAGMVFGGLSIAATGWMLWADGASLLPAIPSYATHTTFWVEFSVTVVGVVGLLTLIINSLHQALHRARSNENELAIKIIEVQNLAEQANQANKFKTQLIARVSHELRTPLGALMGLTEMLYYSGHKTMPLEQRELVQRIVDNAKYLERVFSELLDQTRIESNEIFILEEPFALDELLKLVTGRFIPLAKRKGLALHLEMDPALPPVLVGDPNRIEQILVNLISNAIKFTRLGSVEVRVCQVDAHQWAMRVSDTGIGISPEDQTLIFEPFRQVDETASREFGGVGLGLSIVKQLVTAMKGDVVVESAVGQGSTFTVFLPFPQPVRERSIESNA